MKRVSVDAGGYYKINHYDYGNTVDSTSNAADSFNRYPAYLVMQSFKTYDGNMRVTYRPIQSLSLVSRYEYQLSTINTAPDVVSDLPKTETSRMTSHIIGQDVSWSPWTRFYAQAGANYVVSDTKTPASDVTQAILNAKNNYWTVNFSPGFVIDNKTDLKLSYFYYKADNFQDIALQGVPYGVGEEEHGITATLTRRIRKNLLLSIKYGFFHYDDQTYGGHRDYEAQMIYSSLKYRF